MDGDAPARRDGSTNCSCRRKPPDGEQPEPVESPDSDGPVERRRRPSPPGAAAAAARRRARAGDARHSEPASAGGVQRAGGAAPLPRRAARGPEADPQGPPRHRPRGRRPGRAGLHRGVRRRGAGVRRDLRPAVPGRRGQAGPHRPRRHANTGIEVEARPPGKKIKRLSLLSGGERSLVAVAFLVALFKARPSPFYILDEVEAALDDTTSAGCWRSTRSCGKTPAADHHAPEADHGGRRRSLTASRCAATASPQ